MFFQYGFLKNDGGIDICYGVGGQFLLYDLLEEQLAVSILVGRIGIREVGTDVPFCQCT